MKKKISVIIPAYNEQNNIQRTYEKLSKILHSTGLNYELIFVENGSTDFSFRMLKKIAHSDSHVLVISLSRNFGIYSAYSCGLSYARGDAAVIIDCDLQDPPELIPKMIEKWEEGYDVVYGIRSKRKGGLLRKSLVKIYYKVIHKLSYINMPIDAGDFSLMDRKIINVINSLPEHMRYLKGLRAWAGFKQTGIEYERKKRLIGRSKFSILDYFRLGFESIFLFSFKPLELISYLSFFVVFLTFIGIIVYFVYYLFFPEVPRGFMTLILVILFLGGIQLLCLSIIGQYLAIMFEEAKNRPFYIVKDVLGGKKKNQDEQKHN